MNATAHVAPPSSIRAFLRRLVGTRRPEPSYPTLPQVSERGESNVPGLYLTGEVAGTPLIKLGLNQGHELIDRLAPELNSDERADGVLDVLIVGAGSSGLGAAMRCHELGLSHVVLEAHRVATTVVNMYKGKVLFAEPEGVERKSAMWFEECTREELLEKWEQQIAEVGLDVREHEKVTDLQRKGDGFVVTSERDTYRARKVILAIGKAGNPRKAGVPGEHEHAGRIEHHLSDPDTLTDKDIVVYGGGDVACEAVKALAPKNRVTLVTIDERFVYPKKRNADAVQALADAGTIQLFFGTHLVRVTDESVVIADATGEERSVPCEQLFEMIGAELPTAFFTRIGIKLEGAWDLRKWIALTLVSLFVYSLYALKKFPEQPYSWPFHHFFSVEAFAAVCARVFDVAFLPFRWLFTEAAYTDMRATTWFQQGYLYSLAYTVIMIVFGVEAMRRWTRIARDGRYQRWRYVSLITFQVVFFLVANVVAVQALSLQHAWRAWGLYQPWPLFFNTFHWWNASDPQAVVWLFVGAGLIGTFVVIPLLSFKHGKRFCTWICGCGGLAETLGDRWRHLAPKGDRSRAWEFQNVVVLVAAAVVTLVTVGMFGTRANNGWALAYSYIVDFWLVAVIPIALYPFYGGKVWCRYWCPLASFNGLLARLYGRLRIKSNDACISCTQCSKYCQVGVDVMSFAKNQQSFDNRNSSCIHCGICIDVCPMGVLSFASDPRSPEEQAARRSLPIVG
jgi:NosR/NirI family nitrous oxide reductase transcriptional regulator